MLLTIPQDPSMKILVEGTYDMSSVCLAPGWDFKFEDMGPHTAKAGVLSLDLWASKTWAKRFVISPYTTWTLSVEISGRFRTTGDVKICRTLSCNSTGTRKSRTEVFLAYLPPRRTLWEHLELD